MASCSASRNQTEICSSVPTLHFFKIILDDTILNGRLGIPRKFIRKYGNRLSSPALLKVPNGAKWLVDLTRSNGDVWFQNGWRRFLEHYSLKRGHFLLFKYEGGCNFEVVIFDMSATEIEYPCINHAENPNSKAKAVEVLHETPKSRPQCFRRRKKQKTASTDKNDRDSEYKFEANNYEKALQRAIEFKSENPFFVVTMQPSYINPGRKMCLPTDFTMKFLKEKEGDITLCTSEGRTWPANYLRYKAHNKYEKAVLCNGWRPFMQENRLKAGDVCIFELVKRAENLLKVVIYHVNEDSNCSSSSGGIKSNHPCPSRPLSSHEKAMAIQRASSFNSESPFFMVVMQPAYLKERCSVNIPYKFAQKYIGGNKDKVILQVPDGRTWTVKFGVTAVGSGQCKAKFHHNWKSFALDNNLQVGDVCVFELINRSKTSFKVSMFSAAPVENVPLSPKADDATAIQVASNKFSIPKIEADDDFGNC